MGWSYYRDKYHRRADAIAAGVPGLLTNDTVRHALNMIDIAEAAIDAIAERYLEITSAGDE